MVNWKDFHIQLHDTDKLELLFEKQEKLMQKFGVEKKNIHTKEGQMQFRYYLISLIEELCEITHCMKNKFWTKTDTEIDLDAMYDEVADVWHFFIELMILLDLDATKVTTLYLQKNLVNQHRIKSNY